MPPLPPPPGGDLAAWPEAHQAGILFDLHYRPLTTLTTLTTTTLQVLAQYSSEQQEQLEEMKRDANL